MHIEKCTDCGVVQECTTYHYPGHGIIHICEECEYGEINKQREEEYEQDMKEEREWHNERLTA